MLDNPGQYEADTLATAMDLYPGRDVMSGVLVKDRSIFQTAMSEIRDGMVLGPLKDIHSEPIWWLFAGAQERYGYLNTVHN